MSTPLSDSGLPLVHRVVTGHDEHGRAVFVMEDSSPTRMILSGDSSFLTVWATETVPADLNDPRDGRDLPTGLTLERGSVIRITDILPGQESPFHRTNSIDYGIVLQGAVELELDDGEKRLVSTGGIIIQRGTRHLWRNVGDEVCRIAFILIEAPAYRHDGEPLEEAKPEDVHPAFAKP